MKTLTQRLTVIAIFLFVLGFAYSQGQVTTAQPDNTTPVFLPYVPNGWPIPTLTPTPTVTPTPSIRQLIALGPVGSSTGGDYFYDNPPETGKVVQVVIHSGQLLDNMQFVLNTGALAAHGGSGGDYASFDLLANEYITGFTGTAGCVVDQITIVTNYRNSPQYGWGTGSDDPCGNGSSFTLAAPAGYEIAGLWGYAGQFFDRFGALARQHR